MSGGTTLRKLEPGARGQSEGPLERYLRILEIAAGFSGGIGLSGLAEILELPKTTAHRLAHNLVETGMLAFDEAGRYRLGERFARLAYAGKPDAWIESVGHTLLRDLADATGQACFIARLSDNKIRSVALVAPDTLVRAITESLTSGPRSGAPLVPPPLSRSDQFAVTRGVICAT